MFLFLYLFVLIIFVSSDRSGEHATKHTLFFCREPGRGVTLKPSTKTLKKDVIFSVRAEIPTLRFFSFSFGLSRTMAPSSLYVTCALLGRWVKIRLEFHTSSAKYICVAWPTLMLRQQLTLRPLYVYPFTGIESFRIARTFPAQSAWILCGIHFTA